MRVHWPAAVLMAITTISQFFFWHASQPIVHPDSENYQAIAAQMLHGDWSNLYFRTPGYPGFLALIETIGGTGNMHAVMGAQFFLGCLIPLLLYVFLLPLAGGIVSAICGSVFLLDRYSVGMQSVVLTEFLSQFILMFAGAVFLRGLRTLHWKDAILAGLVFYILLMVRPSFQLIHGVAATVALVSWVIWKAAGGRQTAVNPDNAKPGPENSSRLSGFRRLLLWLAVMILTTQSGIWLWSLHTYKDFGHFTLSLQLGASMTTQTGDIMELAPPSYGPLRDIYVADKIEHGTHLTTIERVLPKVCEAMKMPPWEVSLRYLEINKGLIREHPGWYAGRVWYSWKKLWQEYPGYLIEPSSFADFSRRWNPFGVVWRVMDRLYWNPTWTRAITPYFLIFGTAVFAFCRRRDFTALCISIFVCAICIYNMLLTAMVQATEFGRYRLPIQPLYFSFCLYLLITVARKIWLRLRRPHFA